MSAGVLTAVAAGLVAMLGWGLADFLAKLGVDRIGSLAALAYAHLLGAVAIVVVLICACLLGAPGTGGGSAGHVLLTFGFGIVQAAVYLLVYRAFEVGRLAVLNPIFSSYAGLAALLSLAFLGDQTSPGAVVALVVVFAGVMLLSIERGGGESPAATGGVALILGATVLAAAWTVLWGQVVSSRGWMVDATTMYVAMAVTLVVVARSRTSLPLPPTPVLQALAGIGAAEVVAFLAVSFGFAETDHLSVVAVLSGAFPIPALALAWRWMGDRLDDPLKAAGAAAVIGGVAALAVFG